MTLTTYAQKINKCKECKQETSNIETLIATDKIITYNAKTGTWIKKRVV